ncbi:hypothetical protein AB1Y20_023469 [Prymnesium parvum]|uniref:Thioesterase domain-containing protein n=1 Tax=Prymnesium parvum TaxID=97485 RepID=A0AB34JFJ6_PRYPA
MVDAAVQSFHAARAALIEALQLEYFCDDLEPPMSAFGWDVQAFQAFYQSGGTDVPSPAALPAAASPAPAASGDDPALMAFLSENSAISHLSSSLSGLSWDECAAFFKEGRPRLLAELSNRGVPLAERQKFATLFAKATRPAVAAGQPGGGRPQSPPFEVTPLDVPGVVRGGEEVDVTRYQEQVLRDGIPAREKGLFPPNDELLRLLEIGGWKGCTKGLLHPTTDGAVAFAPVQSGWACGEGAVEHGLDLRWFIKPGLEDKTLVAAVRFGENARIGRGLKHMSVHGGAVETCLDEATAELCKSKLFPAAATATITFKISKPLQPHTTYRVHCKVDKELQKDLVYEISGKITSVDETVTFASCVAKMANTDGLAKALGNA